MKKFEYNEKGIFSNPNVIEYREYNLCTILILTACYPNGKWVFGYQLTYGANKTPDIYSSHPCMKMPFDLVYKTEANARRAAAKSIKETLANAQKGTAKCFEWLDSLILRQTFLFES